MDYKKKRLWITLFIILCSGGVFAGCTSPAPLATSLPSETPTTQALTASSQTKPTLEPSPMIPTPDIELTAEDTPSIELPLSVSAPIELVNPGFEEQDSNGMPSGWEHTGALESVKIDDRGRSGDFRLTHQGSEAYQVETWQTISGLENGWYTLRAWARSSGGHNAVYIALQVWERGAAGACALYLTGLSLDSTCGFESGHRWRVHHHLALRRERWRLGQL
jgi:hypothetical protein